MVSANRLSPTLTERELDITSPATVADAVSIRVIDRSLRPLHRLVGLREVFIAKSFPVPEFKALAAALPNARGEYLDSFRGTECR